MIGENASRRRSIFRPAAELVQAVHQTGTPRAAGDERSAVDLTWRPSTFRRFSTSGIRHARRRAVALLFSDVAPGGRCRSPAALVGRVPMIYNHTVSHDPKSRIAATGTRRARRSTHSAMDTPTASPI